MTNPQIGWTHLTTILDKKRLTGRTYRMLIAALDEARKGKYVMVFAGSKSQAEALQKQAAKMAGVEPYATKIRVGDGEITFESTQGDQWDWESWRARGAFPAIPVYVDHAAIEDKYARALVEWARWDA